MDNNQFNQGQSYGNPYGNQQPNGGQPPYNTQMYGYNQTPYPQPNNTYNSTAPRTSGKAIGSMVCGILAIVFICPYTCYLSFILAIVAVILGFSAKKNGPIKNSGMATAGQVLGFIILGLDVLLIVGIIVACIIGGGLTALAPYLDPSTF